MAKTTKADAKQASNGSGGKSGGKSGKSLGGGKGKKGAKGDFKTYDTANSMHYRKVRIAFDPETKEVGKNNLVTLKFYHSNRNPEGKDDLYTDAIVTATFREDDKVNGWAVQRLAKGDFIDIGGAIRTRLFKRKDGTWGMELVMKYPEYLTAISDLRDRDANAGGSDDSDNEADEDEDDTDAGDDSDDEGPDYFDDEDGDDSEDE